MTVVGVDLSTFRVDTAWMHRYQPARWHVRLGTKHDDLRDRVRACRMTWPEDVTEVCIEMPFGQNRQTAAALMAVVGAVTRSVPRQARCSWISSGDLRKAIGASENTKLAAVGALKRRLPPKFIEDWNEHELDALVACLGWTEILNEQEKA